jgi:nucleoside-diphosphate-sugar epimerase
VNIGNPTELTVREIAEMVMEISGGEGELVTNPTGGRSQATLPGHNPRQGGLGWEPRVPAREGLEKTFVWFAERLADRQKAPSGR